jgi:ParB family transcriptional regulator, chromosome partitioning protein
MSENNQNSTNSSKNSKQRLGRGLGSLLGGIPNQGAEFTDSTPQVKATIISRPSQAAVPVARVENDSDSSVEATRKTELKTTEISIEKVTATTVHVENSAVSNPSSAQVPSVENSIAPSAASVALPAAVLTIPDNARIWTIPVEKLVANSQQPRQVFEDSALKELAASIREKGILQPITAQRLNEREFQIIAGERRWRAAQIAGLKEVPVILRTVSDQDSLELAILENIQRADLNPIEESEAYDHLMKTYHLTQAQVADRLGKERSSVANALRLMALPPEVKLMIGGGELSSGHAKVLLGLESMADQISLAKEVIREKLSVRALEKKVAEKKSHGTGAVAGPRPAMGLDVSSKLVEALAGELQKLIGTRVVIDYADRRGKLSVYFHSDEQLTEVVERMRRGWAKSNATQNTAPIGSSRG